MAKTATKKEGPPSQASTEGKPPRRRLALQERREQLIELGIRAFSGRAYDEVSVDDVAADAGISKGLLYHYFPTKRDFYVATIETVASRLLAATDFSSETNPFTRLRLGLDAYFEFVREHGPAYAAFMRGGVGSDADAIRVVESTRAAFLSRLVESIDVDGLTPLEELTVRGYIGFVETTSLGWVDKRDVPKEELIELWSKTFLALVTPLFDSRR